MEASASVLHILTYLIMYIHIDYCCSEDWQKTVSSYAVNWPNTSLPDGNEYFFFHVTSVIISQVLQSVVCFTHANALKCVNFHAFCTGKCDLNSVDDYGITRLKGYIRNAEKSVWGEGVQLSVFLGANPAVVLVTRSVDTKA